MLDKSREILIKNLQDEDYGIHLTSNDDRDQYLEGQISNRARETANATVLDLQWLAFLSEAAWPVSGTHASDPVDAPTGEKIIIEAVPLAGQSDTYCRNEVSSSGPFSLLLGGKQIRERRPDRETDLFFIYGETGPGKFGYRVPKEPVSFFSSPVVFTSSSTFRSSFGRDVVTYEVTVSLSDGAVVTLTFSDLDLRGTTIGDLLGATERHIRTWMDDADLNNPPLWHETPAACH